MKKTITITLISLILLTLVGCSDRFNVEETLYVDSLGLDYNPETKEFSLYYHIAAFSTLLPTELGATSSDNSYSIGHVSNISIYECIKMLSRTLTKNIALTHIQSVIFSYNYINYKNLKKFVDDIKTYDLITTNFYCYSTSSDLNDVFSLQNPESISTFFSIISSNDFSINYDLIYFTELAQSVYEDFIIIKFTNIISDDKIWQNQDEPITTVSPNGNLYLTKDDKKIFIPVNDYKALIIMNHDYASNIIMNDQTFTIYNQKITIKENNKNFTIKIRGNIYASNLDNDEFVETINKFNKFIETKFKEIIEYSKKENIDIFNLKNILYRKNKLKNGFDYKTVDISFDIKYKLLN